jgi:hypothetical protein
MTSRIGDAVKAAIQDGVGVVEWLLGFGNMDDHQIGSGVFRFSHGTLEASAGMPVPFGRRALAEHGKRLVRIEANLGRKRKASNPPRSERRPQQNQ